MHRMPAWSACWLQLKGERVNKSVWTRVVAIGAAVMLTISMAQANGYREKNMAVKVAKSAMKVTPARGWNSLSIRPGKKAETWTLDGALGRAHVCNQVNNAQLVRRLLHVQKEDSNIIEL